MALGIFTSNAGQGATGICASRYSRPYRRDDLCLERTSLDAITTLVKIIMNCHIMLLKIFIVDPLEMLGIFCMSVLHRGNWIINFFRYGGSTLK